MHSLNVVNELRESGLDNVIDKYHLNCKRHKKYNNLVQLKYKQTESKMSKDVVQECRGIILDESENWDVVAYPFKKFFNMNEHLAKNVDFDNARVEEKVDGSMFTMYFYDGQWNLATSGLPDASGKVHNFSRKSKTLENEITFNDLFQSTFEKLGYLYPNNKNSEICFMFELFTKDNRVIVHTDVEDIYLIGARNITTFQELGDKQLTTIASQYGWRRPTQYKLKNKTNITEAANNLNPLQQEGFVVIDHNFNRVKVKGPSYVLLGLLSVRNAAKLNNRRMLHLIALGETSEFTSYFPSFANEFKILEKKFEKFVQNVQSAYNKIKGIESNKEFAKAIPDWKLRSFFFTMRKNNDASKDNVSLRDILKNLDGKALEKLIL